MSTRRRLSIWLAVFLLLTLVVVGVCLFRAREGLGSVTPPPTVPRELLAVEDDNHIKTVRFEDYAGLLPACTSLVTQMSGILSNVPAEVNNLPEKSERLEYYAFPEITNQIALIKQTLSGEEISGRQELEQIITLYRQMLVYSRDAKLKTQRAALESVRTWELDEKQNRNRLAFEEFSLKTKEDYQVILTNLQLKLSTSSLPGQLGNETAQEKIKEEIANTKLELATKLTAKKQSLDAEWENFRKERQDLDESANREYEATLNKSLEEEIVRYWNQLHAQYLEQRRLREEETGKSINLRQELSAPGYTRGG